MSESESVRIMADGESVESVASRVLAESVGNQVASGDGPPAGEIKRGPGRPRGRKTSRKRHRSSSSSARSSSSSARSSSSSPRPPEPESEPETELAPEVKAALLEQEVAVLAPLMHAAIGTVVNRWRPDKPYQLAEAQMLTLALVPVVEKYFGGALAMYREETALGLVVFAQLNPRLRPAAPAAPAEPADALSPPLNWHKLNEQERAAVRDVVERNADSQREPELNGVLEAAGYSTVELAGLP